MTLPQADALAPAQAQDLTRGRRSTIQLRRLP